MTRVTVGAWPLILMIAGVAVFILIHPVLRLLRLKVQAWLSGVHISLLRIAGMFMRKSRPDEVVFALIVAKGRGVRVSIDELEALALAGGDVIGVVRALGVARDERRDADYEILTGLDLAGYDVQKLVGSDVDLRTALDEPQERLEAFRKREA